MRPALIVTIIFWGLALGGFHFRNAGIDTARLIERISSERLEHFHGIIRDRLEHLHGIIHNGVNELDEKTCAQLDRIDILIQGVDKKTEAHMEMLRVYIERVDLMSKELDKRAEEYLERLEKIAEKVARCLYGFQWRGEYFVALLVAGSAMATYWAIWKSVIAMVSLAEAGWNFGSR
ncbi:hypothetical protein BDD12DRAFT_857168 [Trichophaea hybrida]|nr:hypothetical protein BDD12DRAFT_867956 [Trichophaea hybrida]KAF8535066.1 hypothetical protein BDD12DRAFT_857168 [Trichophaea hybrida]